MLVGLHLDNVDQPPESSYRRIGLAHADLVLTLWTAGTKHRRPVYQRLKQLGVARLCIRVGDEGLPASVDAYLSDVDAALNEALAAGYAEADIDVQCLNEPNLGTATAGQVGAFLGWVVLRWRRKARIVLAPVSRGKQGWQDYARAMVGAAGSLLGKNVAYGVHLYATDAENAPPCDPSGVPFVVTEFSHPNLTGQARGAWVVVRLRDLARKGYRYAVQFISDGKTYQHPPEWPPSYRMTDEEATVIGARGALPAPDQGGQVPDQQKVMLGAMWRQGGDLQLKDQGVDGLLADLKAGGFALAIADVAQGTTLQGTFSKTAVDFPTVDAVVAFAKQLHAGGQRFWPMVNVLGEDPAGEASLHAQITNLIALAVGEPVPLIADFERYPGFFDPSRPEANGDAYFAAASALLDPGNEVWACIDPREPDRDYRLSVLARVKRLLLQTYDKDFQQPLDQVYAEFLNPDRYGGKPIYPMVQGDDPTATIGHALDLVAGKFALMVVWGFGSLVGTVDPNDVDDLSVTAGRAGPYVPLFGSAPPVPLPFDRGNRWDLVAGVAKEFREKGGTHADQITANALEAAFMASKVMNGAEAAA